MTRLLRGGLHLERMPSRACRRLTTTLLVVLSLLFSQLALATYLCPAPGIPGAQSARVAMELGEPCEGMASDEKQPVLCYQHCANPPQSADSVKLPTLSLPAVIQVILVPLSIDGSDPDLVTLARAGEPQPPPEPLFLATLRLRV